MIKFKFTIIVKEITLKYSYIYKLIEPKGLQKKLYDQHTVLLNKMVGKTGFEPATPWSQTKCSTKLSHFPIVVRSKGFEPLTFWFVAKHSIQLSYECNYKKKTIYTRPSLNTNWWLQRESNQRHRDFQSLALPTEL